MEKIIQLLREGDLRSVGNVSVVMEMVELEPSLFSAVIKSMAHEDPGVRMRASDAVEKISRQNHEYLQHYKSFLINQAKTQTQQEVRWHLAQIFPRLGLTESDRKQVAKILFSYLDDSSKIVQTNSLQALVDLAWEDDDLLAQVKQTVESLVDTGSPAVQNRAKRLLIQLVRKQQNTQSEGRSRNQ